MRYEVIDSKNKIMFCTCDPKSIHNQSEINSMITAGYKIKINDKVVPKSKIMSVIKEFL